VGRNLPNASIFDVGNRKHCRFQAVLPRQEAAMSKFREKAEAQTKQVIGQMIGDELLVREGREQLHHAEEGAAGNQGSRHGFETGMPKPHPPRAGETDQGIVRDERGQEQPKDKTRARHISRVDRGGDAPGRKV